MKKNFTIEYLGEIRSDDSTVFDIHNDYIIRAADFSVERNRFVIEFSPFEDVSLPVIQLSFNEISSFVYAVRTDEETNSKSPFYDIDIIAYTPDDAVEPDESLLTENMIHQYDAWKVIIIFRSYSYIAIKSRVVELRFNLIEASS